MSGKSRLQGNSDILKETTALVEYFYGTVLEQFDKFSAEKWNTENKIRRAANDVLFYTSQAAGSLTLDTTEYDWNYARKNLLALKTMYVFGGKQGFLKVKSLIVAKIDKLIEKIDVEIARSKKETDKKIRKELEPWQEKYRLWKEMQSN
jgi:UDP-N-acetylglucosamine:LPS N-acetylglucosamine transferase